MTTFLIDTENVGHAWVEFAQRCGSGEKCVLFFTTPNAPNLTFRQFAALIRNAKHIECIECRTGHNALDFQLATELGYRLRKCQKDIFVIVSNDTGFDVVVKYWKDKGFNVTRTGVRPQISVIQKQPAKPKTEEALQERLLLYSSKLRDIGINEVRAAEIASMVQISARRDQKMWLTSIYTRLIQAYGQKEGLAIYRSAKSTLSALLMDAGGISRIQPTA